MKWIKFSELKPEDGQRCLAKGYYIIDAFYDAKYGDFYNDNINYGHKPEYWMPIELFNEWANKKD